MYTDPSFKTNISIENIRTENFISYVYIKFLTTKPSKENKCYRLWIEDLNNGLFDLASLDYIWIDRFDSSKEDINNSSFANKININRNKTLAIPVKLYMQEVSNNRFIKRCRFHLKKQGILSSGEQSVWISDEIVLPSREIQVPEINCKSIHICKDETKKDFGRLECRVNMVYPTARDETNFNLYLTPYVLFYDKNNLVETEAVGPTNEDGSFVFKSKGTYAFDFTKNKTLDNAIKKIAVEIRFLNGALACRKEFVLDSFSNYASFYADDILITKNISLGIVDANKKIKNVIDIYRQP